MNTILKHFQHIRSDPNFSLNLCMLWVCFGYYYKLLGLPVRSLWTKYLNFIDVNHWVEMIVYCPLLWFTLYYANRIVFRENKNDKPFHTLSHKFRKHVAAVAIALNLYGMGIHAAANTIEIYSREQVHVDPNNEAYQLTYLLDEDISHWVQFVPFFFAIGWYIINDRLNRFTGPYMSVFMGVGHGVDRAVGVIEGNSWYFGIPMSAWILICCYIRYLKYDKDFKKCIEDYFFRHGLAIGVTIPSCQLLYFIIFGGFVQPSAFHPGYGPYIYMVIYTFGGAFVFFLTDVWRRRRFSKARDHGSPNISYEVLEIEEEENFETSRS